MKPRKNKLTYSPSVNPMMTPGLVPTKRKRVQSSIQEVPLLDARTGELCAASVIHQIQEVDTDHFVKIFTAGVAATYELGSAAQKTFNAILRIYSEMPMTGGYAEFVALEFFDNTLSGKTLNFSTDTFSRGMKELLQKEFISPRTPTTFWVNPALFFKGDRVLMINEYRKKGALQRIDPKTINVGFNERVES